MARREEARRQQGQDQFEEIVVNVKRCVKVVKGGKRMSFAALVVVGDRAGKVGYGYGKAKEVPFAVQKGIQEARKALFEVPLKDTTIPHTVRSKFSASEVMLRPACKGTGIKAGAAARAVLELAGITDILAKVYGSTNSLNVVKATVNCLKTVKTKKQIEALRATTLAPVE